MPTKIYSLLARRAVHSALKRVKSGTAPRIPRGLFSHLRRTWSTALLDVPVYPQNLQNQESRRPRPLIATASNPPIPGYLLSVYSWAYVYRTSIRLLDNQFLVNMVLWGNANRLRDAALSELDESGRTLQVACVYGNFTQGLLSRLNPQTSSLDVIDVVPDQLENMHDKIESNCSNAKDDGSEKRLQRQVRLSCYNAESLGFPSESFDQAVFYMLLHEIPTTVRKNAIREACRVLKPGGRIVFIDFHRPESVVKRFFISIWFLLEPFAKDLWVTEIKEWLPNDMVSSRTCHVEKELISGGLFQKVVVEKLLTRWSKHK